MKIGKNIALLSITIVTLITLVALATYSYFTASTNVNNKITTNVKMPLRPTFTVSGGGEMTLTITGNILLQENAHKGDDIWIEGKNLLHSSKNLTITLTGEPGTTCTYNIYYKDLSLDSTIIRSWDFLLRIFKNNQMIISYDPSPLWQTSSGSSKISPLFSGSSSPYNGAKPTITIPSGNTIATDDWKFMLYFHNREWDQSYLADKTLKGEFYIGDVVCS